MLDEHIDDALSGQPSSESTNYSFNLLLLHFTWYGERLSRLQPIIPHIISRKYQSFTASSMRKCPQTPCHLSSQPCQPCVNSISLLRSPPDLLPSKGISPTPLSVKPFLHSVLIMRFLLHVPHHAPIHHPLPRPHHLLVFLVHFVSITILSIHNGKANHKEGK